jgi:predicted ATPase
LGLLGDSLDPAKRAEAAFIESLQSARYQGALAWELRTAVSCAKLYRNQGRLDDARSLLTGLIGRFDCQTNTQDLSAAKTLLAQL